MDAIVLAGGIPKPDDPLFFHTQGNSKAMVDINGKPMIQWVLDALNESNMIDRIVVVGLTATTHLKSNHPISFIDNYGEILLNIQAGARELLKNKKRSSNLRHHALLVASDIPAISSKMVDWLITKVEEADYDFYYCVIERSAMETRFPGSKRSFYHLKDMEVTGGDLNAICTSWVIGDNPLYQRIIKARKNAFKQAALIGLDILIMFLLRQLTIQRAEKWAGRKLKCNVKAIVNPYPETGMDVDKSYQLELMRGDFKRKL